MSEKTKEEICEELSTLFLGHDRDERQYTEDDLMNFMDCIYTSNPEHKKITDVLLKFINGDMEFFDEEWEKYQVELESRKDEIDLPDSDFKSYLYGLIDEQKTITKNEWINNKIDELRAELKELEERSKNNWSRVFTTIALIDHHCREIIDSFVYNDEKLFSKLFNEVHLEHENVDRDQIVIFTSGNSNYFYHIEITPTICCYNYSNKVIKFKNITADTDKFYLANRLLIQSNTCCKHILEENYDDAMSSLAGLMYSFSPFLVDKSKAELNKRLGKLGSDLRWGPQQKQRIKALELAEQLWNKQEHINDDHAKMADHLVCLPKENGSLMFDKLTKEYLLPEMAKLATKLNKPVRGKKNK